MISQSNLITHASTIMNGNSNQDNVSIKRYRDLLSLRSLSVWIVIWGNLFWIMNYLLAEYQAWETQPLTEYRLLFLSACLASVISLWLLPRLVSRRNIEERLTVKFHRRN